MEGGLRRIVARTARNRRHRTRFKANLHERTSLGALPSGAHSLSTDPFDNRVSAAFESTVSRPPYVC